MIVDDGEDGADGYDHLYLHDQVTSGAGRMATDFSSWKGSTHHGVLYAQRLTLRVLQAVPSGHYPAPVTAPLPSLPSLP
jgi:hypothetical protein